MNRRGFLGIILAAATAPAIVRADSLMRIVPRETTVLDWPGGPFDYEQGRVWVSGGGGDANLWNADGTPTAAHMWGQLRYDARTGGLLAISHNPDGGAFYLDFRAVAGEDIPAGSLVTIRPR